MTSSCGITGSFKKVTNMVFSIHQGYTINIQFFQPFFNMIFIWSGLSFRNPHSPLAPPPPIPQKKKKGRGGGGQIFPKKEGSLVKLVSCSKNRVGYLYFHTNLFQCHLSRRVVGVFYSFTRFLSVFFAFHRKDLVLLNLIGRYLISPSD